MQRRNFLLNTAVAAGTFTLFGKKSFASSIFDDPVQFKLLRGNVGMYAEKGGTIAWLINKEGIVVVDAEFPDQANHLIAELKKQSDQPFECSLTPITTATIPAAIFPSKDW